MESNGAVLAGLSESEFVEALQARREDAFERLVESYGARMLAVARRIVGDEEQARDVVQEAFVSAFRAIGRFRGQSGLGTWLHRIVVNTALTLLRKRRRARETSIEPLLPAFLEDGHQADPAGTWPDDVLERSETREIVRAAIEALPDKYRAVLLLRDIEEMSTAEAATALGISPGAVKVRLHRARQALRQQIEDGLHAEEGK